MEELEAINVPSLAKVDEFQRKHRIGLLTLVFTDIVGSTDLKRQYGDGQAGRLIRQHHELVREVLRKFPLAEEIETAGDSFLLVFAKPSDAAIFALYLQTRLQILGKETGKPVLDRIGIHVGEVSLYESEGSSKLFGIQVDTCARLTSLAAGHQILMTRFAFDNARPVIKGTELERFASWPSFGELRWFNHGFYLFKGLDEPIEVCEVRAGGDDAVVPPTGSEKARPFLPAGSEPVLGWRPAVDLAVPGTEWVLQEKLGAGGFGEVWLGYHRRLKEKRVFKFCFRADHIRSLKREVTLFRLLKDRIGGHPNIVGIKEVYLEEPPCYIEMEYISGKDLRSWCEKCGGIECVPLETRLEIVAQIAGALQAAHDSGIIHRDLKPGNILIESNHQQRRLGSDERPLGLSVSDSAGVPADALQAKLTDFGIGQVISEEYLAEITRAGFTQTVAGSFHSHSGTQMFMAPELLAGKPASTRSDIYSLGIVLYQLVIGDFSRPLTTDWAENIRDPLLREDLGQCFAGNPQDRFSGAAQLGANLRNLPQRHQALVEACAAQAALERAAYRRGVARTAVAALLVLAVVVGLAITAGMQARRANAIAKDQRLQLYVNDMKLAQAASEENDLGLATSLVGKYRSSNPELADLRGFEWRYLWNLCQGNELFTLRHDDFVCGVALSSDASKVATASRNQSIQIWDTESRKVLARIPAPVYSSSQVPIAFSEDGRWFASAQSDRVLLRDTATWEARRELVSPKGDLRFIIAFSPDSTTLAAVGWEGVFLWDLTREGLTRTLPMLAEASPERQIAFTGDGRFIVAGTSQGVLIWDRDADYAVHHLPFGYGPVSAVAVSKQGQIAMAGREGHLSLWDLRARRQIGHVQDAHETTIYSVAFSPDGKTLASGAGDQLVRTWSTEKLEKGSILRGHLSEIWCLTFSVDGRFIASGSKDETAKIWSTANQATADSLPGSYMPLTFLQDGKTLVALTSTGVVEFWNVETAELLRTFKVPANSTWLHASSRGHVAARIGGRSLQIWDPARTNLLHTLSIGDGTMREIGGFRFSPDGTLLGVTYVSRIGELDTWAVEVIRVQGQRLAGFKDLSASVRLAFSHNNQFIAVKAPGFRIRIYEIKSERLVSEVAGHRLDVTWMDFSPDDKSLASSSADSTARLWNVATGREQVIFKGHREGLTAVKFSPDGKTLFTGSTDDLVKMWNVATGQEMVTLRGLGHDAGYVEVSPDGRALVVGPLLYSEAAPIRLFRAPSLIEIEARGKGRR